MLKNKGLDTEMKTLFNCFFVLCVYSLSHRSRNRADPMGYLHPFLPCLILPMILLLMQHKQPCEYRWCRLLILYVLLKQIQTLYISR